MIDLDELGARARAHNYGPPLALVEVQRRARVRTRRRNVVRTVAAVAVAAVVTGVSITALHDDPGPTAVVTTSTPLTSLATGEHLWPDETRSFTDPRALAQAFVHDVLGGSWSVTPGDTPDSDTHELISVDDDAGHGGLIAAERADDGTWSIASASTLDALVVLSDGMVRIDRPGQPASEVEILHRPLSGAPTTDLRVSPNTGPWSLPGISSITQVGSVLTLSRDLDGDVIAFVSATVDGAGPVPDLSGIGTPASMRDLRLAYSSVPTDQADRDAIGWSIDVDARHRLVVATDAGGAWVCMASQIDGTDGAGTCTPGWRFLQAGAVLSGQDAAGWFSVALLPVVVTQDQIGSSGTVTGDGHLVVLDPNRPGDDRLTIPTPWGLVVL
jgi:hypothetical protein